MWNQPRIRNTCQLHIIIADGLSQQGLSLLLTSALMRTLQIVSRSGYPSIQEIICLESGHTNSNGEFIHIVCDDILYSRGPSKDDCDKCRADVSNNKRRVLCSDSIGNKGVLGY
jgi:hypothetical protein